MKTFKTFTLLACTVLAIGGQDAHAMNFNLNKETVNGLNQATENGVKIASSLKEIGVMANNVLIPQFDKTLVNIDNTVGSITSNVEKWDSIGKKYINPVSNLSSQFGYFNQNAETLLKILNNNRKRSKITQDFGQMCHDLVGTVDKVAILVDKAMDALDKSDDFVNKKVEFADKCAEERIEQAYGRLLNLIYLALGGTAAVGTYLILLNNYTTK